MKRIMLILILCALSASLFCDNLSDYPIEKVKLILTGKDEGLIGWERPVAGGKSGPSCISISFNNKIFVPDRVNKRINIYDLNGNFLKNIKEKNVRIESEVYYSWLIKIDHDENIIASSNGLKKINQNGEELFYISYNDLPTQVKQFDNFFPIDSDVFIFDDNEQIAFITDNGQIINNNEALNKLKSHSSAKTKGAINNVFVLPADKKDVINKFAANPKYMIVDEDYFSSIFYKTEDYFKKIKNVRDYVRAQKQKQDSSAVKNKTYDIDLGKWSMFLIGYDNDHNGYWRGIQPGATQGFDKEAIVVFSKYGELLDAFYYGQYENMKENTALFPTTNAVLAVAPNGDVYFLVGNEKEYTFYKVTRRW